MIGMRAGLLRLSLALGVLISTLHPTYAAAAQAICYRGINISGAEYGDRGGALGTNYLYPTKDTVRYFAGKGMNVVRLPFRWERLQPVLNEPLDEAEVGNLRNAVDLIHRNGMAVILDPHNFGYYDKGQVTRPPATDLAFGDFWGRLALEFANEDGVIFGLMNEPHDIKAPDWLEAANTAIRSIRTVGARNLILVPGTIWSGAWTWDSDRLGGGANSTVMLGVRDPLDYYAYELHQYLDADSSGTHDTCEGADQARQAMVKMTDWLRQNGRLGFLGEFGAAGNDPCVAGLKQITDVLAANTDVWLGWTYWAAGDWWPPGEPMNVQPRDGKEKPQMRVIAAGLGKKTALPPACAAVKPAG